MLDQLHARYADGVNRKRSDLLAAAVHAGRGLGPRASSAKYAGRDSDRGVARRTVLPLVDAIFHSIHTKLVEVDSAGTASQRPAVVHRVRHPRRRPGRCPGCSTISCVLGADGAWQFATRRHDITWRMVDGGHQALPFPTGFDRWVR